MQKDPLAGQMLGHFLLLEQLGAGGMGVVYRAHDERLDRDVAIKILPAETFDENKRKQLRHEAQALAKLNHPNIATIYEFGSDGSTDYLVMELLTGPNLADKLLIGPLPQNLIIKFGIQIAEALQAAHNQGILHRDLKPGNVGLTADNTVKLLDFGLAKLVKSDPLAVTQSQPHTRAGLAKGTLAYMSPEQLRGEAIDERADIYSAGATLYQMAVARSPHPQVSEALVINAILNEEPAAPTSLNRKISPALQAIILKAMEKDPDQRYATARELAQDLERLNTAAVPIAARQASNRRLRRLLRPAFLIAFLIIVGLAAWQFSGRLQFRPSTGARPMILVGDFENNTGEPVFDNTLREMFTSTLEQSQVVEIFPTSRLVDTLKRMGRSPTQHIDESTGREIVVRENLQGVLLGSIARLGHKYVLLARIESPTGGDIATAEASADSADDIPARVDQIAESMRRELGESLRSVKENSVPLAQVSSSSLDAVRYFTLGKQALYKGNPDQAISMFGKAVELDKNFAVAREYLGASYQQLNRYDLADQQIRAAAELASRVSEPERLRIMAAYYSNQLDPEKACENYQLLSQLLPQDPSPYVNLGVCKKDQYDYDAAASFSTKALKFVPQSDVRVNLASQLVSKGDPEQALEVAQSFTRDFPNDPFAQSVLGRIYVALGRTEDARQMFTQMTRLGGEAEVSGRLFLADLALSSGQYGDAEKELKSATAVADRTHNRVGAAKARIAMAEIDLHRDPSHQASRHSLTQVELPPNSPALELLLGRTFAWTGDIEAANRSLRALDELLNHQEVAAVESLQHLMSAEIALAKQKPADAVDAAQKAVTYQKSPFAVETLARCYAAADMNEQAAQEYEALIAVANQLTDDSHVEDFDEPAFRRAVEAHYRLAVLYQKLGRSTDARAHLQKFLSAWSHADADSPIYKDAQRLMRSLSVTGVPTPAM